MLGNNLCQRSTNYGIKLESQVATSNIEAKYISHFADLCNVIYLMQLDAQFESIILIYFMNLHMNSDIPRDFSTCMYVKNESLHQTQTFKSMCNKDRCNKNQIADVCTFLQTQLVKIGNKSGM